MQERHLYLFNDVLLCVRAAKKKHHRSGGGATAAGLKVDFLEPLEALRVADPQDPKGYTDLPFSSRNPCI